MSCSLVAVNWLFRGTCCCQLQGWRRSHTRNQHEALLLLYLAYSSTLKMEELCSFKMSADFQNTTQHFIPEDRTLHSLSYFQQPATFLCSELYKSTISSRSTLILSSCPHVSVPSGHFSSGFLTKTLQAFHILKTCAACLNHLNLYIFFTLIIFAEEYKLLSFPLCPSFFPFWAPYLQTQTCSTRNAQT
jgi:hypothetical protein